MHRPSPNARARLVQVHMDVGKGTLQSDKLLISSLGAKHTYLYLGVYLKTVDQCSIYTLKKALGENT